jgi:hypothetical protein
MMDRVRDRALPAGASRWSITFRSLSGRPDPDGETTAAGTDWL